MFNLGGAANPLPLIISDRFVKCLDWAYLKEKRGVGEGGILSPLLFHLPQYDMQDGSRYEQSGAHDVVCVC